ncbi:MULTISPECIES: hybrid sensor histidine kinase/response regulator [Methylosinus]|uniref:histidine kinase n=1 Tax=Methylosinus trichosporium (strain ATCC 35070 / NCIMB 11131 / UNIQEM 75 / OB3b) TaxID=595536 RepID=A0A2D2CXL5_METT3|nr:MULTISPECIES: hybrid sensor histidine kinase/response regulator [Methylosinus]ATQ67487.1 hybrid sensor histidine kinase/response regulator [Methylosinus trichosporium OB3b]OBS51538.1 hybrid sensor histidine kinase/response regulator [Methylosinus sp. 3S-1]
MMKAVENTPSDRSLRPPPLIDDADENAAGERPVVLIVDDSADNLLALEAMLRCDDFVIATALSGRAALDILLAHHVAVAIIDVQMPEMDGFELATLMRGVEKTRDVPIVFVTAGSRETSRMFKGYEVGAVDYLWKPIDEQILRSKVDVFVRLERQRQQLLQAERMREMFVAILGHDLRNPLQGIKTATERTMRLTQDEEARKTLESIRQSGDRMARMIAQILDVTQMRAGAGLTIRRAPTELSLVVEQIVDEFSAHRRLLRVEYSGDTRGVWDADRLLQLVSNLVGNAVEHGPPGGHVHVRVDGRAPAWVKFEVHNGGCGLPKQLRDVLFEPFRSGDRTRGLGLGLFICKQIVEAHGGAIDVESTDETGTAIRISLPRRHADDAPLPAPLASGRSPQASAAAGPSPITETRRVILLIDDDVGVRESLELALMLEGFTVVAAADGDGAAARIVDERVAPDLIVSDFFLRKSATGSQVVMRLRELLNRDAPAIILTGGGSLVPAHRTALANSVRLGKPVEIEQLTRTIYDLLSRATPD